MSDLRRFFVVDISEEITVTGEEFKHAVSVLRVKVGERIIFCNNTQNEYIAEITSIGKKEFTAKVVESRKNDSETTSEVTLIFGYLKGDKNELIVQKAVELGVKNIVAFSSEFSSAFVNENKLERLNRVSLEASKQCGRSVYPKVSYAPDFESALNYGINSQNKIFACEFASESNIRLEEIKGSTAIVIGSEGGFSHAEKALADEKGYSTLYLGKRILRAETACIATCALVMRALGELG
jgi:16S rRNA (uracil1498-N3)-methyltransferase